MSHKPSSRWYPSISKVRLWLTFYEGKKEPGTPARTVAEIEADVEVAPGRLDYPDKLVARVLAWLVKICEGRETTKPTMPPEIAEYVAAAVAAARSAGHLVLGVGRPAGFAIGVPPPMLVQSIQF